MPFRFGCGTAALCDVGRAILDHPDAQRRDLALAEAALGRANQLTHGENPDVLRALARLRAEQGQAAEAVALFDAALRYAAPADRPVIEREKQAAR